MARRPGFRANVMTRGQLRELERSLSLLSPPYGSRQLPETAGPMPVTGRNAARATGDAGTGDTVENPMEVAAVAERAEEVTGAI
jgi:hypothetical protein